MATRIFIHDIARRVEEHTYDLSVSIGDGPRKQFIAWYDGSRPTAKWCSVDEKLFMRLSDLGLQKFGNSAIYHMELVGIVGAFDGGQQLPPLPLELGTTSLGPVRRPGRLRIIWNKLCVLLRRLQLNSLSDFLYKLPTFWASKT